MGEGNYYLEYLMKTEKIPQKWYHKPKADICRKLVKNLPYNSDILDAACGNGYVTGDFSENYNIYGIDCENEAVEFCKKRFPKGIYTAVDIYNLPFSDNKFDLILFNDAIEHLFDPEKAVKELIRVLKPKGIIEICTVNYNSPLWLLLENTWYRLMGGNCKPYDRNVHPARFTKNKLKILLEKSATVIDLYTRNAGMEIFIIASK